MPLKNRICYNRKLCFRSLSLKAKILFLVMCVSITGCQSSGDAKPNITLNWEIKPSPPRVGKTTLNLTLRDSTDKLITGADVKLEGNMSHPGMKPVIANAEEVEPGQYSAEINFTMAGDWFIIVTTSLGDSSEVEKQIKIPGVRSQ